MASAQSAVEHIFRAEYGRVVAALTSWCGDLSLAEDAVQDAFAVALETWRGDELPRNPAAWITTTARNRAIDRLRRARALQAKQRELVDTAPAAGFRAADEDVADERLRLIFTCCHPTLSREARVTLTLKLLGGLTVGEIARAFLLPEATVAKRVTRAKRKIRDAGIPFELPPAARLAERIDAVLLVVYLVFNEGYAATAGDRLVRGDLCGEAIRLGELLCALLPGEPEALGLTALMLLQDSRRRARVSADGRLALLEQQDRTLWDAGAIARGRELLDRAARSGAAPGPYRLQAAIAAVHAGARSGGDTDWVRVVDLYAELARAQPTPVVELNHAVAIAMRDGPDAGLRRLEEATLAAALADYLPFHAARADLLRRAGRAHEAAAAYARAEELASNAVESAFLAERRAELALAR